jgi:hypothetical protein
VSLSGTEVESVHNFDGEHEKVKNLEVPGLNGRRIL